MAFLKKDLTRLAGGNGFTLWHYKSAVDAIADINTAAYFTGDAVNMLGVRDLMIIVDTATPSTHLVTVLSNDGTTVDIADGTVLAETDGD